MDIALLEAVDAEKNHEVPVGAVIVYGHEIVARAGNLVVTANDPLGHAEMRAIRLACQKLGQERLVDCDLYVTLEPCTMCAAAISFARIRRLYYGASDSKGGAVENGVRFFNQQSCHHRPDVYGHIRESACATLLKNFFAERR